MVGSIFGRDYYYYYYFKEDKKIEKNGVASHPTMGWSATS
jgi:hypothetical protein